MDIIFYEAVFTIDKRMFCSNKASIAQCITHMKTYRSMDACLFLLSCILRACFHGRQQCCQFMLYLQTGQVYKISVFKEYTLVCPFWKFQIWNTPCLQISRSKSPFQCPWIPDSCPWYGTDILWNCPIYESVLRTEELFFSNWNSMVATGQENWSGKKFLQGYAC